MCQKEEDMSSYKEGQINQLANSLEAEGFTSEDITKLGQFKKLSDIRGLFRGTHEIKQVRYLIDCDTNPFVPEGWKVEQHDKGGQLEWNLEKVKLYLSKNQKDGKCIGGNKLRKELENKPVLNANVLDYLLKNPHLIPEEWKSKYVFFWGTVYRSSDGSFIVRYLYWDGVEWGWDYYWLVLDFHGVLPAVVLAS